MPDKLTDQEARLEEILNVLEGKEINSAHFEGPVTVIRGQLWRGNVILEPVPSLEEARILLNEIVYQEFGTDAEIAQLLEDEFGDS
jgi:hypothetical protein